MAIYSALEDFVHRTVEHIGGMWSRLRYFRSLRREDGRYEHWGLERSFGELPAHKAMEQAHQESVTGLLRTPIARALEDAEQSARSEGIEPEAFVQQLQEQGDGLLPDRLGGGSARHFNSILLAVLHLVRARKAANRRAS